MKFLTNLSLWKKISILTAFGLALGAGVFSSLGMRAVNQATEAMLQERLTTAHLVADYVDEALARAINELTSCAESLEGKSLSPDSVSEIESLKTRFSSLSIHAYGVYVIDENGDTVYSSPATKVTNIAISSFAGGSLINGKAGISGILSDPATGTPVVLLFCSFNGDKGNKRALAVAIDLPKSSIGLFVRPVRLGQTGYVEIVDQNGVVITRTDPGPKLSPFEKSDHSGRFAALINAGKPTRGICHTCHESEQKVEGKDVLAFVPISQARWGVVVRQSEDEALAPARELQQNLIFFGLGLVTIAILFVVVTTRNVGSRIKTLTLASQRIADGDLTSEVGALGKDEVGILAQTFDDMRSKLKTSYSNLEQKTRELSSLLSVSGILTSTPDLPRLLDSVVAKAVEVISGADCGILLLENEEHTGLKVQCVVGLEREFLPWQVFTPEIGADTESVNNGQETSVKKAVASFVESNILRSKIKNSTYAGVFHRSRCIGGLIMISFTDASAFSDSNRRLLQAIADDTAIAIERAQLAKEADDARALHEADRLRSEFISSVSHELRTPLTIIKGYSTSLLRQNVDWDKETQREFLQSIDEKTDELRDLIDKILQSAKLEAGALKLEKEPVLLPRLAQKIIEENEPRVKRHKFFMDFPKVFPVIEADARCIEQVVRNLVENAVKYSPGDGSITITGETRNGEVVVSVTDNGVGIPLQNQDKIFERFYRVESRFTRGTTGCGLGLSISKGHVEAHGGKIWFESQPGKGSKFYFSLPLSKPDDGK